MDAAETLPQLWRQRRAQRANRQPGGVAGDNRVGRDVGRYFFVQPALPVHALGNGLNHQVAFRQLRQMLFVVGLPDEGRILGHAERCRLELL